jgi:hypothetical protein
MQQQALAQQQAMFNEGVSAVNPFVTAGQGAASTLSNLLKPGSSASALASMPGFQFQSQYGTMAAQNALAGKTGASAGPLAAAISQYNNGLAGTQYFNTVNALQNLTNTGAGSANSILTGAINSGNAQASTLGNIGNAQASGTLGSASALSNGLSGVTGSAANASLLYGAGQSGLYSGTGGITGSTNALDATDSQANAWALRNGIGLGDI